MRDLNFLRGGRRPACRFPRLGFSPWTPFSEAPPFKSGIPPGGKTHPVFALRATPRQSRGEPARPSLRSRSAALRPERRTDNAADGEPAARSGLGCRPPLRRFPSPYPPAWGLGRPATGSLHFDTATGPSRFPRSGLYFSRKKSRTRYVRPGKEGKLKKKRLVEARAAVLARSYRMG